MKKYGLQDIVVLISPFNFLSWHTNVSGGEERSRGLAVTVLGYSKPSSHCNSILGLAVLHIGQSTCKVNREYY